jgi:Fe2+ transport system protein FeoA
MLVHEMPLAMASPGEEVRVVDIRAGRGLRQRLADMGLTPGTVLKVLSSRGSGPTLIECRGSRLVLGFGVAQKVMVEKPGG